MTIAVTEQELKEISQAPRVAFSQIQALMERVTYVKVQQPGNTTSTFVHAFLDGKFLLGTGFSACVNEANFNADIGERLATEKATQNATNKLWELEGYKLYTEGLVPTIETSPLDRLIQEAKDLEDKMQKLEAFYNKGKPDYITDANWTLLLDQLDAMNEYNSILNKRIANF